MIPERHVVTCFLENEAEILILRRSSLVGSFQGKWAGVSGYVETTADEQSLIEIAEETGLGRKDIKLLKKGRPLEVIDRDAGIKWVVHPYLFRIPERNKVKIDWEHCETQWIDPKDIASYETVPRLKEALARVFGE
jgi:8-oxo-dGTP pyrophosphatase MutT (NUDIX family)